MDTFLRLYEFKFNENLCRSRVFAMKHAITFKTVGQDFQLQPSKLMDFIISIVKVIKKCPRSLIEIKKSIEINTSDLFEFGKYLLKILNYEVFNMYIFKDIPICITL